jgi:16S rRNA (cytidine1402-2'-O)-methyltransferase
MESASAKSGILWVVSTPIGNLDDMAPRAVEVLGEADAIAAEDTRHSGRLLKHFGIQARQISLHEHNEAQRVSFLVKRLEAGDTIAVICDAGTPLISDPGYRLVRAARHAGIAVSSVPGPCAAVAALSIAGLPTDRFRFEGFLPPKAGARDKRLDSLKDTFETVVFYETPRRVVRTLRAMTRYFGPDREAVLCRELTKLHETVLSGSLESLIGRLENEPGQLRGEMVLVVAGEPASVDPDRQLEEGRRLFELLRQELSAGKAAKLAASWSGCRRRDLYQ